LKNFILSIVVVLTCFLVVGCTNQNPPDENTELPEDTEQQILSDDQLVQYEGKVAIITEDVVLKDPYVITVDTNDNNVYQTLENEEFQLNKNDMVIVIEENGNECRVVQAFGDIPRIRGTIDKSNLSFDESLFANNANQAVVKNAMSYDEIDGNEKGLQDGVGTILERKEDWLRMSMPMQESDLWFKSEDLSYDFDTSIIDIEK
jgi:hypothetical protein